DLSREIRSLADDYITQIDINHVLGKLFDALAANRISTKRATSLAYIADLLMRSQGGAKQEARCWDLDLPIYKILKNFPANSFACHSYGKTGGGGALFSELPN
ncbi:MAG TPA: hypothetical protein VMH20_04250, partial [Verrucomicrobiae bacterium]|nr:hypothetical protein [Verrucomicrobiae bacterium]